MDHIQQNEIKDQYISFAKNTFNQQGNNYMIVELINKKKMEDENKEKEKVEEEKQ